jgi:hypothetical protein
VFKAIPLFIPDGSARIFSQRIFSKRIDSQRSRDRTCESCRPRQLLCSSINRMRNSGVRPAATGRTHAPDGCWPLHHELSRPGCRPAGGRAEPHLMWGPAQDGNSRKIDDSETDRNMASVLALGNERGGRIGLFQAALFTRTTVILSKPSSNTGGFSFSPILRMISSLTERSRLELRSRQTSRGTSKKTACTS